MSKGHTVFVLLEFGNLIQQILCFRQIKTGNPGMYLSGFVDWFDLFDNLRGFVLANVQNVYSTFSSVNKLKFVPPIHLGEVQIVYLVKLVLYIYITLPWKNI